MNAYPWQEKVFVKLASNQNLPHALLLKGRAGIGKLDFAHCLAESLLCESRTPSGAACGNCVSCHWLQQSFHPDFRMIEPEFVSDDAKSKQITVEQIRMLVDFVNISTHRNGFRVILLHPAEAMNTHAANALLKTLEEPPPKTIFILVSHKPQRLLPTILSRCQSIQMPFPDMDESKKWLREKGVKNADACLAEAGNAPLLAFEIAGEENAGLFLNEVSKDAADPLQIADQFQKTALSSLVSGLQKWCYDIASFKFTGTVRYFPDRLEKIREIASKSHAGRLMDFQKRLFEAQKNANHPLNPKLFLEALLLSYLEI